jgi:hypothetical protein
MLPLYVLPLVAQAIVPLALLASLRFTPVRGGASTLLRLFMTAAYLITLALADRAVVPGDRLPRHCCAAPTGITRSVRSSPRWPQRGGEWFGLAMNGVMAIAFVGLAGTTQLRVHGVSWRARPHGHMERGSVRVRPR